PEKFLTDGRFCFCALPVVSDGGIAADNELPHVTWRHSPPRWLRTRVRRNQGVEFFGINDFGRRTHHSWRCRWTFGFTHVQLIESKLCFLFPVWIEAGPFSGDLANVVPTFTEQNGRNFAQCNFCVALSASPVGRDTVEMK